MTVRIIEGDCRDSMRALVSVGTKVQTIVTSPPYFGLRDYGHDGQIGLESSPAEFIAKLVDVFDVARDLLADDGTLWINMGDSYANDTKWGGSTSGKHVTAQHGDSSIGRRRHTTGLKSKDLMGIPWRLAFALQDAGWYLRQDIIWSKPNPMPESVTDRCTKAHEYVFLLSKSPRYYFDSKAISEPALGGLPGNVTHKGTTAYKESDAKHRTKAGLLAYSFKRKTATTPPPGSPAQHRESREDVAYVDTRNKRSVWTVATQPFSEAHFATFPPALIEPCILAGSRPGDLVLDPFGGAGTTGLVADRHGRSAVLCELNPDYAAMARRRIFNDSPLFVEVA